MTDCRRFRPPWRGIVTALIALAAIVPAVAGGCGRRPSGPNVALIVLDTVRRDFTGAGADSGALSFTPTLDRLAAAGAAYPQALANAPWTVPSHASFFTGQLPSEHGCATANLRFVSAQPTLADLLVDRGFVTAAFYSNPWLADRTTGLLRGFALKFEAPIGSLHKLESPYGDQGGRNILGHLDNWLRDRDRRRPFFIFINFLEAHLPYDPPADYRQAHLADLAPDDKVTIEWGHEFNAGLHPDAYVDWSRVRRLYGGDVNTADRLLAGALDLLRRHGADENTVLIVTSDHGENLGDHGLLEHQFSVHETVLAVPLVIVAPPAAAGALAARGLAAPRGRDERPVMLTDLYATVLAITGVRPPVMPRHSRSLLAPWPPEADSAGAVRPLVAEYDGPGPGLLGLLQGLNPELDTARLAPALRTVRWGDWRLTAGSDGGRALHNLRLDPGQTRDYAGRLPRREARLDSLLAAEAPWPAFAPAGDGELDEATRRQLRALGYVR